jgi:SAM-dependent methyltransferase
MDTEKTALRPCPVCGKNRVEVLTTMRYAVLEGSPLPSVSDIVCCLACGMVYADTPGTQADYDRFYTNFSRYDLHNPFGSGDEPFDARRIEETAGWLETRIGAKNTRIVDIGCAKGGLLKALSRRGFSSLAGIDPSAHCVEHVRAAGFSAWQGHLSRFPVDCGGGGEFDFIILSHVLEHVVDVHGALSSLRKLLAPGGKIYLEVPDASRYHNRNAAPFLFIEQEHINHFDRPHLAMLCGSHGLSLSDAIDKDIGIPPFGGFFAFGILAADQGAPSRISFGEEDRLKKAIATYIFESQRRSKMQEEFLTSVVKGRSVALWGAGIWAERLLATSVWKNMNIVAIVDRDLGKQGKHRAGHVIQTPEEGLRHLPENTLVIIAAFLHAETIRGELSEIHPGLPHLILTESCNALSENSQ